MYVRVCERDLHAVFIEVRTKGGVLIHADDINKTFDIFVLLEYMSLTDFLDTSIYIYYWCLPISFQEFSSTLESFRL